MPPAHSLSFNQIEKLMLIGYRHILAAHEMRHFAHVHEVQALFISLLGGPTGQRLMAKFKAWAYCLLRHTDRLLHYAPPCCPHVCYDERIALSILATAQLRDYSTGRIALGWLTENTHKTQEIWHTALGVADCLNENGLLLKPVSSDLVMMFISACQAEYRTPESRWLH